MPKIPRVMSTQHPDNVRLPFFAESPDMSGEDEIKEAYYAFSHLGCDEQMWDCEGKEVDAFVVRKRVYPSFSKRLVPEITNFCQSRLTCNAMDLSSLIMERVNKNDYRDNRSCLRAKGDDPMVF